MSGGGSRRGRRDNGIDATDFAVAGDVDPRVGEHMLDVLAANGIAAYLQPSADLNPVTRTTTVPSRPVDRLYVDRAHLARARDFLTELSDEGGPAETDRSDRDPDVEAEWAKIIAGYHLDAEPGFRPWPTAEDVPDPPAAPPAGEPSAANPADRPDRGIRRLTSATDISGISLDDRGDPSLLDGLDTFGADLPDDPEEGYTPPPPPPLPRLSKYTLLGVLAVVLGFTLFLFPALLPIDQDLAQMVGFAGILTGFVMLVWRLRPGDDDVDPDDGAVV